MKKFFFIIFFLPSLLCFAQEKKDTIVLEKKMKTINISATKSNKSLDALPIPATLISEKEIIKTGASKLDEVISKQTGIISVPTKTGTEGLQIQGIDASYTAILLDGYPIIGRSFGALDLNRISITDIEKIEFIRGASSSLYGSNALGGVINLVSKRQIKDGEQLKFGLKLI